MTGEDVHLVLLLMATSTCSRDSTKSVNVSSVTTSRTVLPNAQTNPLAFVSALVEQACEYSRANAPTSKCRDGPNRQFENTFGDKAVSRFLPRETPCPAESSAIAGTIYETVSDKANSHCSLWVVASSPSVAIIPFLASSSRQGWAPRSCRRQRSRIARCDGSRQ